MPIQYVIDSIHQRMLTHAVGLVTFQDVSQHLEAFRDVESADRCLQKAGE